MTRKPGLYIIQSDDNMINLNFNDIYSCKHIKRWHCSNITWTESVAAHQWGVAFLSLYIADKLKIIIVPRHDVQKIYLDLLMGALFHDYKESMTGDIIPNQITKRIKTEAESGLCSDQLFRWGLLLGINHDMDGTYIKLSKKIIKVADLLDTYLFAAQNGINNSTAPIAKKLKVKLHYTLHELIEHIKVNRGLTEHDPNQLRTGELIDSWVQELTATLERDKINE